MDILNLSKKRLLVIIVSFFLFYSCTDDKDKNCTYMNLRPYISIYNFQPADIETEAYLLVYPKNNFKNKIDSLIPKYIRNAFIINDGISIPSINVHFENSESKNINLNTNHNYILVTNNKTKYMISDYSFKQVSRKMLFYTKKYCLVDSMKVNNINVDDAKLRFSKKLGLPLKIE